jgi:glycogen debranching enzyme
MASVYKDPALAWDQLMVMFDQQDGSGGLPDSINDEHITFNYCKPPVHGWALDWMMKRTRFIDRKRLGKIYGPLCRWTEWWFKYRDDDRDGIPQYNHGNDSGWDNCTTFDGGAPVEGPDLSAFLVKQMDVLAEVAAKIGRKSDARCWRQRADGLLARLIAHSWRGDRFVSPRNGDHRIVARSNSLFNCLPIILGRRLPAAIRAKLAATLCGPDRLTKWGLATESPYGPLYDPDGYWRGPIWAPTTLIVVDGLWNAGEKELARTISRRFCALCKKSGFAENYDAVTGQGLRDPAYTWTSSVFLILAHEYAK